MQSSDTFSVPKKVIGIGASADDLQTLEILFDNLLATIGMAFIVIPYLSPDCHRLTDQLFSRHSDMPVRMVSNSVGVEADHIYVLPCEQEAIYSNGRLLLTQRLDSAKLIFPIDEFFRSLAKDAGETSVGVVLSGAGTDGSRRIRDIHSAVGMVIVQATEAAEFSGMQIIARDAGVVEFRLAPHEIALAMNRIAGDGSVLTDAVAAYPNQPIDQVMSAMRSLFALLHREFGIDLSCDRSEIIARRIERRVQLGGCTSIAELAELASRDATEWNRIYDDILISVTNFFRDAEVFDRLEEDVLPSLLDSLADGEEFRCWVAGAATGKEAYTLAILLTKEFQRRGYERKVRIFASDVHELSLAVAGQGVYCEEELTGVSTELRQEFFIERHDGFQVTPELRKMVVFAPHDVVRDAPFTQLHLITCRYLLADLPPDTQQRVLSLFHFGLKSGGALCLGSSESLGKLRDEFCPVDESLRTFGKPSGVNGAVNSRERPFRHRQPSLTKRTTGRAGTLNQKVLSTYDTLLQRPDSMAVLINSSHQILHLFGGAGQFLVFANGRLENDLQNVIHQSLRRPLSLALVQLRRHGGPVLVESVACEIPSVSRTVSLEVELVKDDSSEQMIDEEADILVHIEVNEAELVTADANKLSISQVKTMDNLERELQCRQDRLQSMFEELQSTNAKLKASNEELKSTNKELYLVNAERRRKIEELTERNDDIDNLLTSTNVQTLFLDSRLRIRRFTPGIADVFNLGPRDTGRPIASLTHTLTECQRSGLIKEVISNESPICKEVQDKSGQWSLMSITPYVTRKSVEGAVVTLVDLTYPQAATEAFKNSDERFALAARGSNAGIRHWENVEEDKVWCSDRFLTLFELPTDTSMTMSNWRQLVHPQDRDRVFDALTSSLPDDLPFDLECRMAVSEPNEHRWMRIRGAAERFGAAQSGTAQFGAERSPKVAGSFEDVTDLYNAEEAVQRRDQLLPGLSHELRNPLAAVQNATTLILNENVDTTIRTTATSVVQRQLGQMSRRLDDLLDVSRVTHGKLELRLGDVDLREVVQAALMVVRATADVQKMQITTELSDEPVVVNGDSARLERVVVNLLVNAIKYSPDGGPICIRLCSEDGQAVFEVEDSGVGIPSDSIEDVFSLFYQSDETLDLSRGGMGVGLTLVDAVVRMHGGKFVYHSEGAHCGSRFTVKLPAMTRAARPEKTELRQSANSLQTIVLVEDIDNVGNMFAALLAFRGYEGHQAGDGAEGAELIERIRPDAAIIDIGLPKSNGHQVAQRIRSRQELSGMPLVALTGHGQDSDRDEVQESGVDLHLVKPLDPSKLDWMLGHLNRVGADRFSA
ncbi:MAG: CheR family methyltransferase [Fuerstiella sp.]